MVLGSKTIEFTLNLPLFDSILGSIYLIFYSCPDCLCRFCRPHGLHTVPTLCMPKKSLSNKNSTESVDLLEFENKKMNKLKSQNREGVLKLNASIG